MSSLPIVPGPSILSFPASEGGEAPPTPPPLPPPPPILVGLYGASASGKSHLARLLHHHLGLKTPLVGQDAHFRHPTDTLDVAGPPLRRWLNWESPRTLDMGSFIAAIEEARVRAAMERDPFVIIEGFLLFADARVASRFHVRIFFDIPKEAAFTRRLARNDSYDQLGTYIPPASVADELSRAYVTMRQGEMAAAAARGASELERRALWLHDYFDEVVWPEYLRYKPHILERPAGAVGAAARGCSSSGVVGRGALSVGDDDSSSSPQKVPSVAGFDEVQAVQLAFGTGGAGKLPAHTLTAGKDSADGPLTVSTAGETPLSSSFFSLSLSSSASSTVSAISDGGGASSKSSTVGSPSMGSKSLSSNSGVFGDVSVVAASASDGTAVPSVTAALAPNSAQLFPVYVLDALLSSDDLLNQALNILGQPSSYDGAPRAAKAASAAAVASPLLGGAANSSSASSLS